VANPVLNFLTGGETDAAQSALGSALEDIQGVNVPTAAQLTLPQLQAYVNAGLMTPAQATAALQQSNAYNNIQGSLSAAPVEAETSALNQLGTIAQDQGLTPTAEAQIANALNQTQTQEQGANASVEDQFAQKGIPTSLMGAALQTQNNNAASNNLNLAGVNAAAGAQQNALTALSNEGTLGSTMQGEQYTEAANKAAAQNAINQWNAANTTQVSQSNANLTQAANLYNTTNTQNVANANTQSGQYQQEYNAAVPQTVYSDAMQKAAAEAGVNEQQANQATAAGQQMAGFESGLLGAGATLGGSAIMGNAIGKLSPATNYTPGVNPVDVTNPYSFGGGLNMTASPTSLGWAKGGLIPPKLPKFQAGRLVMDDGGPVPGTPVVNGDSRKNDHVPAMLSPGEGVIPRTKMANPSAAANFARHLAKMKPPTPNVHPADVANVLEALTRRRAAVPA